MNRLDEVRYPNQTRIIKLLQDLVTDVTYDQLMYMANWLLNRSEDVEEAKQILFSLSDQTLENLVNEARKN